MNNKKTVLKIGFVGVGTMASAIVRALISHSSKNMQIFLSPRSAERTKELAAASEIVTVTGSNQEVLDHADWIILGVTPQVAEKVLPTLKFNKNHHLISLISPVSLARIKEMVPAELAVNKVVPLPFIEHGTGPILLYPDNDEIYSLFSELGHVVTVENEYQLDALITVTALASPFYRVLSEVIDWGSEHDLSVEKSADYTLAFFGALLHRAQETDTNEILDLWREMTPGGLNQRATQSLEERSGFSMWHDALDIVLDFFADNDSKKD